MRLHIASMALSLAVFTRHHTRTVTAFTLRPLTSRTATGAGLKPLAVGAVEGSTDATDVTNINGKDDIIFPLKGKDVLQCPPRMRFAPSPTGR